LLKNDIIKQANFFCAKQSKNASIITSSPILYELDRQLLLDQLRLLKANANIWLTISLAIEGLMIYRVMKIFIEKRFYYFRLWKLFQHLYLADWLFM